MALISKVDLAQAADRLRDSLIKKFPDATGVGVGNVEICSSSGMSTETILFDAQWERDGEQHREGLVARVEPAPDSGLFMTYDLRAEAELLRGLRAAGIPVPEVGWFEDDRSLLGGKAIIMQRIPGRVPPDDPPYSTGGWVLDLNPDQRSHLIDNALEAMASVHAVDWRAAGLSVVDRPVYGRAGVDQRLGYWERAYRWASAGDEPNPTVESALRWLRDHQPSAEELVLSWGDARIGNMIFADDLSVAAIIDWEVAAPGTPEMDLGWWLMMQTYYTEGVGAPIPDGIPGREATLGRYEAVSGRRVDNIHYYEVLAAAAGAITCHRLGVLMRGAGMLLPDSTISVSNPISHILARLLDLPAPGSTSVAYVGHR